MRCRWIGRRVGGEGGQGIEARDGRKERRREARRKEGNGNKAAGKEVTKRPNV